MRFPATGLTVSRMKVVTMRMHFGLGLVLVVVACLSGCCCPMTCAPMGCCPTPCWVEHLQDSYYCFEDQIHQQSCCMQRTMACNWQKLTSGFTSQCNCHTCQHHCGSDCSDCAAADCAADECREPVQPKSRMEITGPRPLRDPPPPGFKAGRCKRCRQSPCRCGHCEGCSGFETVDTSSRSAEPSCAAPRVGDVAPNHYPAPPTYEPPPAPAHREPTPIPPAPASGPTPVRPPPPSSAPPKTTSSGVQMQSAPVDVSVPVEQGPMLEQIGYRESVPTPSASSRKRDGWQPVQGSKPVR